MFHIYKNEKQIPRKSKSKKIHFRTSDLRNPEKMLLYDRKIINTKGRKGRVGGRRPTIDSFLDSYVFFFLPCFACCFTFLLFFLEPNLEDAMRSQWKKCFRCIAMISNYKIVSYYDTINYSIGIPTSRYMMIQTVSCSTLWIWMISCAPWNKNGWSGSYHN